MLDSCDGRGTASSNSHPSRSCKCHIFWEKLPGERETPARVFFPPTPTNTLKTQNLHAQLCPTLGDSMDCSPPGSSVHGISQARILEWVAMPSSRGSSRPRELTCISCISCIGRQILYHLCDQLTNKRLLSRGASSEGSHFCKVTHWPHDPRLLGALREGRLSPGHNSKS